VSLDVNSVHLPAIHHGFYLVNYLDLFVVERGARRIWWAFCTPLQRSRVAS
jgi:hypothetical protein